MGKKIIAFSLIISIIISSALSVLAKETTSVTVNRAEELLLRHDLDREFILTMEADEKIRFAKSVLAKPEAFEAKESISHFDEISATELFVNSSNEELLALGMKEEDIQAIREDINRLKSKSDEQLKKEFEKTDEQIKLLRMALAPNDNYYQKELSGTIVSTSGDISTSQLYFVITKTDNSSSSYPVSYRIYTYFRWDKLPYYFYDDDIGISWGGDLNSKDFSRYYYGADINQGSDTFETMDRLLFSAYGLNNTYYSSSGTTTSRIKEHDVTGGIIYNHNMELSLDGRILYKIKSGTTYQTIYQTKSEGKETKVVARYAHKVPSIWWSSISLDTSSSVGFGINLGFGYDYSPLVEANPIKY